MSEDRICRLIERWFDDHLSPAEDQELARFLANDPTLRDQVKMLGQLRQACDQGQGDRIWRGLQARQTASAKVSATFQAIRERRVGRTRGSGKARWAPWGVIALAATVLLAVGLYWAWPHPYTGHSSGIQWHITSHNLLRYQGLHPGERLDLLPHERALGRFADGTTIAMDPGSSLTFVSQNLGKTLELSRGTVDVTATAQPTGQPLRIQTPHAMVTVLGTQFRVDADEHETKCSVNHGEVQLRGRQGQGALQLTDGESAVFRGDSAGLVLAASWAEWPNDGAYVRIDNQRVVVGATDEVTKKSKPKAFTHPFDWGAGIRFQGILRQGPIKAHSYVEWTLWRGVPLAADADYSQIRLIFRGDTVALEARSASNGAFRRLAGQRIESNAESGVSIIMELNKELLSCWVAGRQIFQGAHQMPAGEKVNIQLRASDMNGPGEAAIFEGLSLERPLIP